MSSRNAHPKPTKALIIWLERLSHRSNIDRLLSAFCLEEPDGVPNLEYWVTSVPVLEYVLGKRFPSSIDAWTILATENMIEFARRIGMDAVGVYFSWRLGNIFRESSNPLTHDSYVDGCIKDWDDLDKMEEPPDIRRIGFIRLSLTLFKKIWISKNMNYNNLSY